jgi:hypothetical protein
MGRKGAAFGVALLALLWGSHASANPDYPAAVVAALGLPGVTIDPPNGCKLCHQNESGGLPLNGFGSLMENEYGVQKADVPESVKTAMMALEAMQPNLVADIRAGIDPNTDLNGASIPPQPEYGCAIGQPSPEGGGTGLAAWALVAGFAAMQARRARARRATHSG